MEGTMYGFQNLDHRSQNINLIKAQVCVEHPDNQPVDTGNWCYYLPRFRQDTGPIFSSVPEEKKLPTGTNVKNEGHEKRFLVFDQSGDRTRLLYSSGIGAPIQPLNANDNWLKDRPIVKGDTVSPLESYFAEELIDHQNDAIESDIHEDTEELNALLYSDNDYSEDDEETSTGHSPCTKRKKLLHGGYSTPSAIMEDDAESSCGNSGSRFSKGFDSFSGKKRSREENIHDTIRILQKVIPVGQGKDNTIDIIDEAINYLKSLKAKAKDLGL